MSPPSRPIAALLVVGLAIACVMVGRPRVAAADGGTGQVHRAEPASRGLTSKRLRATLGGGERVAVRTTGPVTLAVATVTVRPPTAGVLITTAALACELAHAPAPRRRSRAPPRG